MTSEPKYRDSFYFLLYIYKRVPWTFVFVANYLSVLVGVIFQYICHWPPLAEYCPELQDVGYVLIKVGGTILGCWLVGLPLIIWLYQIFTALRRKKFRKNIQ